jgi:hypothetical protein
VSVTAVAAPAPGVPDPAIVVVLAMLGALERPGLAELERALAERLNLRLTAAKRRVAELGVLAELLNVLPLDQAGRPPTISRDAYDAAAEKRGATDSKRLVERYGSWRHACRSAYGLLPDGRYVGQGTPWSQPLRGQPRMLPYTQQEVRDAIRVCGLELGRPPSSHDYHCWNREKRRRLRRAGVQPHRGGGHRQPRIPNINVIYRFYPEGDNRWLLAARDAALTEVEIATARAEILLGKIGADPQPSGPLEAFATLTGDELTALGISAEEAKCVAKHGFGAFTLPRAVALANKLGGSLDWLAGRALDQGGPASIVRFDGEQFRQLARERKRTEKEIREQLGLQLGPYRRILNGTDQPTLAELAVMAQLVGTEISGLCTPAA